jgi:hypothetical protein
METPENLPTCERQITHMFNVTLIPLVKTTHYKAVPIGVLLLVAGAVFSPLYYPNYYLYQPELYSLDLAIICVVYSYLSYIYLKWDKNSCFEHTAVSKFNEYTCMGFYSLFMIYWLIDGVVQFTNHAEKIILIQVGNIFMSAAWFFYFSTSSLLYYFICIKLAQRTQSINDWLKNLKRSRPSVAEFYEGYKIHHKAIKTFGRGWNFIVLLGFIILTYHIPIDLFSVIFNHKYTDITGIIVKTGGLTWYTYQICTLNDMDNKVISYLYKHNLYSAETMDSIEKYAKYHILGLNFYGIKIDGSLIIKVGLLTINLIIPTIYALVSNKLIGRG